MIGHNIISPKCYGLNPGLTHARNIFCHKTISPCQNMTREEHFHSYFNTVFKLLVKISERHGIMGNNSHHDYSQTLISFSQLPSSVEICFWDFLAEIKIPGEPGLVAYTCLGGWSRRITTRVAWATCSKPLLAYIARPWKTRQVACLFLQQVLCSLCIAHKC